MSSSGGWIGVDLDGTLAEYGGWVSEMHIGEPIPAMAERVRGWLAAGRVVKIFTARVCEPNVVILGEANKSRLPVEEIRNVIQDWTEKHFGVRLEVTNVKDFGMVELWDDRAVRVVANKGEPCCPDAKWTPSVERAGLYWFIDAYGEIGLVSVYYHGTDNVLTRALIYKTDLYAGKVGPLWYGPLLGPGVMP